MLRRSLHQDGVHVFYLDHLLVTTYYHHYGVPSLTVIAYCVVQRAPRGGRIERVEWMYYVW